MRKVQVHVQMHVCVRVCACARARPRVRASVHMLALTHDRCLVNNLDGAAAATAVNSNTQCRVVSLSHNRLLDAGVAAVCDVLRTGAQQLDANWSESRPSQNTSLSTLRLANVGAGERAAHALADLVAHTRALQRLQLSSNKLGDKGATLLAAALQANSSLVDLDLSDCQIGSGGARMLGGMLTRNGSLRTLDLSWNAMRGSKTADLIAAIADFKALSALRLGCNVLGGSCLGIGAVCVCV